MSEVPELSDEARAFLVEHASTGEPRADELERVQARLEAGLVADAAKPRRRLPIPGEWLAVAAVLVALLVARGVFALVHDGAESRQRVLDAYRAGDLDGALAHAKTDCRGDECAALEAKLAKAAGLSSRMGALTPSERQELGELDAQLAPDGTSAIAQQLRTPRHSPSASELLGEARELLKEQSYELAMIRLERCVKVFPADGACRLLLGTTYARIGARDQDESAMKKARDSYERFLELAPPGDENVARVRKILAAVAEREPESPSPATPEVQWDTAPRPGDETGNGLVVIRVGESGSITVAEDVQRIAIGDSSVAFVSSGGPRKLTVRGMEPGKTTLLFWLVSGARQSWLIDVREK